MTTTDIYFNETITTTAATFHTLVMNSNLSTTIESSSLADLCKNFHVSFYSNN
jgi:hypothetical protein